MSDYPKHVTCPACGNDKVPSEMHIVEWIGICFRDEGGCGNIWSLESGIPFEPQPPIAEAQ
jgi:hypothetical protein